MTVYTIDPMKDERWGEFQLGGIQMLLWRAIQHAKTDQLSEFDMGRSECDNSALERPLGCHSDTISLLAIPSHALSLYP
jgi:hypothetical protein